MMALLSACQSVPAPKGFNAAQIALLEQQGFKPVDQSYDWYLTLPHRLLFPSDRSELDVHRLEDVAELSRKLVSVGIRSASVEGHTDSTASEAYNLQLSYARAQTVARPMIANGMILAPEQIIGRGKAFPVSSNDTPEGRQDNRRVVIIVTPF